MENQNLDKVHVALAADSIIYAPFYTAYYGGMFKDTYYGGINVNIVGGKDDQRFKQENRGNIFGDGFAACCLLFNFADICLGDPSIISYFFFAEDVDFCSEATNNFLCFLHNTTIDHMIHNNKDEFSFIQLKNGEYSIDPTKKGLLMDFIRKTGKKVKLQGGLMKLLAYSVLSNSNDDKDLIFGSIKDFRDKEAIDKKLKLYHFKRGSTCYNLKEKMGIDPKSHELTDAGKEIETFLTEDKSYVLTCDLVAVELLIYKEWKEPLKFIFGDDYIDPYYDFHYAKYLLLGKYAKISKVYDFSLNGLSGLCDSNYRDNDEYMLSGVFSILDEKDDNLSAFLVSLNQELEKFDNMLENKNHLGLKKHMYDTLLSSHHKDINEIIQILLPSNELRKEMVQLILAYKNLILTQHHPHKTIYTELNTLERRKFAQYLIFCYVNSIFSLDRSNKRLYYSSLSQITLMKNKFNPMKDFNNIIKLTLDGLNCKNPKPQISFNEISSFKGISKFINERNRYKKWQLFKLQWYKFLIYRLNYIALGIVINLFLSIWGGEIPGCIKHNKYNMIIILFIIIMFILPIIVYYSCIDKKRKKEKYIT